MNWLVAFIQHIAAPPMPIMETSIPALAAAAHCSPGNGDCTIAAFTVSTGLIGFFCVLSVCWMHARLRQLKDRADSDREAAVADQDRYRVILESLLGLQLACDAQEDMVERIPFAVAVFDGEHKLAGYNGAYAGLWELSQSWLESKPCYGEILDCLRDKRKLPEQRNFPEWKQAQIQAFSLADSRSEEFWHLPIGKSIRIVTQPHLQGGVFVLFEDITERLRLESALNLLTQVQKATLDTLDEGIAIFGTDGRLVLHNALFAIMWRLPESELDGQPHFTEIANLCTDRIGRDGIWGIVSCAVDSATPDRFGERGNARRADGRIISLALSRLPNGATVATFTDITDLERFSGLQNMSYTVRQHGRETESLPRSR